MRVVVSVCFAAFGTLLLATEAPVQPRPEELAQTQRWLGGSGRLAAVRSLEIVESDRMTLRLLFPERYQIEAVTDAGTMVTSFNGRQILTAFPNGMPAGAHTPPALDTSVARQRGLANMAIHALMFLGRILPEFPMTVSVRKELCANVAGTCLEFRRPQGSPIFLVVADDGRPIALVRGLGTVAEPAPEDSVWMLDDYRVVDGIKFPFRVTSKRVTRSNGSEHSVFTRSYRAVVVNPPFAESLFDRRR